MVDEDLEPLITRCPNCATQFRVTEIQLAAAGGRVRCGACLTVFEGTEYLILDEESSFSDGAEADAALDALLDELGTDDRALVAEPEPAEETWSLTQDVPVIYGGFEDDQPSEDAESAEAESLEDDEAMEAASAGVESIAEIEPVHDASKDEGLDADYKAWIRPGTPDIDQMVEEVVTAGVAEAALDEAPVAEKAASTADDGFHLSAVEKALEAEGVGTSPISFAPEPRRWWLIGVAALLALTLAAQVFYLQMPEWSRDPGVRGAYEAVCGLIGCELPEIRAVDAFRTRNLMVRSHPDFEEALVIDAVIVNQAGFEQRFPGLELRFTSVGGLLVAGRTFQPEEYLAGEVGADDLMPINTPVQVSLEISDPGPEAVNYTLSFR